MASGSTGNYAIPYPIPTDPVNVTGDIEALATRIDNILQEEIEDTAASMWTGGTFTNGIVTPTYNDSTGKMSMTLTQDIQISASPTFVNLTATNQLISSVATGTSPISVSSSTVVSNLNSDLLDGQQGSYYLEWSNVTNKPDPTITLTGDVSGSATLTDLTSASMTVAVIDDSHSHTNLTISNLSASAISSGTLSVNRGGTGVTTSTGTGSVVLSDSPSLVGIPTAPTPSASVNNTQLATTAFVQTLVSTLGGLPSQTGNAGKYLTTDGSNPSWATVDLSSKANIASPTFTGTVTVDNLTATGTVNIVSPTADGSTGPRDITMSTASPSGGNDGDVWLQYS